MHIFHHFPTKVRQFFPKKISKPWGGNQFLVTRPTGHGCGLWPLQRLRSPSRCPTVLMTHLWAFNRRKCGATNDDRGGNQYMLNSRGKCGGYIYIYMYVYIVSLRAHMWPKHHHHHISLSSRRLGPNCRPTSSCGMARSHTRTPSAFGSRDAWRNPKRTFAIGDGNVSGT